MDTYIPLVNDKIENQVNDKHVLTFKIVESKFCDYWASHFSHAGNKLNFGFTIGVVRFDISEKMAFDVMVI